MKSPSKPYLKKPLQWLGGILVTFLTLWILAVLNHQAHARFSNQPKSSVIMIDGVNDSQSKHDPQPNEPETPPNQPEVMTVDLDMPPPEPIDFEPLDLELTLDSPTVLPVEIDVEKPPSPKPVTKPSPAKTTSAPAKKKSGARKLSDVDQPPRESRHNARPAYPADLLQRGIEGTVVVRLLIDETGHVKDVEVVSGEREFVRAVLAVAYRWRFSAARDEGRSVKVWAKKRVYFNIRR